MLQHANPLHSSLWVGISKIRTIHLYAAHKKAHYTICTCILKLKQNRHTFCNGSQCKDTGFLDFPFLMEKHFLQDWHEYRKQFFPEHIGKYIQCSSTTLPWKKTEMQSNFVITS